MLKEKNYGSKKKNRRMAFMRREGARAARKFYDNALDKAFKSGKQITAGGYKWKYVA